jgi:hypothetical protein
MEDTNKLHNSASRMGDMRTHVNTLAVKLNDGLFTELLKAASEATDEAEPLSVEEYASEIIEAYMATRRLEAADKFIDSIIPAVDARLTAYEVATPATRFRRITAESAIA